MANSPRGPDRLVRWFHRRARPLPWRGKGRTPYRVMVSEFMLQQTQVDRVTPRFLDFVEKFPSLEALAAASEDAVLEAWSGLGYYRRARLLHQAARAVMARGGEMPREVDELLSLPGLGPYTAAAVASLAFGRAVPVVDGNVLRVGARQLALPDDPRKAASAGRIRSWVQSLLEDHSEPAAVNEALMELGATVCLPRNPTCSECPLAPTCRAHQRGNPEAYPPARTVRAPEEHSWVAACCVDGQGQWLLHRQDRGGLLRGLWLPPLNLEDKGSPLERGQQCIAGMGRAAGRVFPPVRHSITYRRILVTPVMFPFKERTIPEGPWAWRDPRDPGLPTSSLLGKLVSHIEG